MRSRILVTAIAAGLFMNSHAALAAAATNNSENTPSQAASQAAAELAQLRAALADLQAKVASLEERTEAQSDINVSVGQAVETTQKAMTANDVKVSSLQTVFGNTTLSGKVFLDFTHVNQRTSDGGKTNATGTGTDVKRFYLGVSHAFDDTWSANLTTDFNYVSSIGQTSLFVKKAYVQGKFSPAAVLRVGSSDMPWIPFAEGLYGYRYVENTLTDRLKFGASADWGVHLAGDLGAAKKANYAVSMVNGGGFRNPSRSQGVDFEGRLGFTPIDGVVVAVGGYSGQLGKDTQTNSALHTARRGDILAAYVGKSFRFGGEYFTARNWNNVLSAASDKANGYSFWGSASVATDVNVFARYDHADLSTRLDDNAQDKYFNLGVEYLVTKGFKLAGVWKHDDADKSVSSLLVRNTKTNEIGLWGELAF